jgi:AcrR family transcriptional regulator
MRPRDENKQEAVFNSIIHKINEVGYANISMSQIAKDAGVSASTLYVYYENKEDMFRKIYIALKGKMLDAAVDGIRNDMAVKDAVMLFCRNLYGFYAENPEYFLFLQQSACTSVSCDSVKDEPDGATSLFAGILEKGVGEGVLKEAKPVVLMAWCMLGVEGFLKVIKEEPQFKDDIDFEQVFEMTWDAIKK